MQHWWHAFWLLIASSATAKVRPLPLDENKQRRVSTVSNASTVSTIWEHVNKTCLARDCDERLNLQHLWHIERYMRHDIDPCIDFYAYACGNWKRVHAPLSDKSVMSVAARHINERYMNLFEHLLQHPQDPLWLELIFEKLVTYYKACKESEKLTKLSLTGYVSRLLSADHKPLNQDNMDWLSLISHLGRYGYNGHFILIDVKQYNATKHLIRIEPHNPALKFNFTYDIYAALMPFTNQTYATLRMQFEKLEHDLALIVNNAMPAVDYDTILCYCLAELYVQAAEVDWQRVLTTQFGGKFNDEHLLLVDGLVAIKEIVNYLNNANATLLRVYTWARFLSYIQDMPKTPLHSTANGYNCVCHMRKTLYLAMNYGFERAFYATKRAANERIINQVFKELKQQFSRTLTANAMQLSSELVEVMQQKLWKMRLNLGNIPLNASQSFYNDCVEHLQVGSNFYENHLQSLLHYYTHLSLLESTTYAAHNAIWYTFNLHAPNMVDAIDATPYFYCLSNIIIIPYAYLQLPFYDEHFWSALLYGDLANTLGHELLHAFDSYFVDYDPAGNMRNYSSVLEQNQIYMNNLNCLNYTVDHIFFNERIADISGTHLALHTFMNDPIFRQANGRLYFLQFSQFFCGDDGDLLHDSGSKRLNYTLSQMPEFAEIFNCTAGSPMNPARRCAHW